MTDAGSGRAAELVRAAELAAQAGRRDEAAAIWARVLELVPEHPRALFALSERALRAGDLNGAHDFLERAHKAAPNEAGILVNLAIVERARSDHLAELAALERAIAINESSLPAHLMKGAVLERLGRSRRAAKAYRAAVALAPDNPPADLAPALAHARGVVESQKQELESYLLQRTRSLRAQFGSQNLGRFDEALGIAAGTKKVFVPKPADLLYPQLPAIGYFDEAGFPWLRDLEAQTDVIRDELKALIVSQAQGFEPYVQRPANVPVQQWGELNNSTKWSAYFLWKDGHKNEEHCTQCPRTAEILARMPMTQMPNYAPTAFFSSLEPGARIPPHTGATNARVIVHLPLIVPPKCTFRVANETRTWEYGKAWVFDDSIEHDAANASDRQRVILIFDVWNPALSEAERALIGELQNGLYDFFAAG
jgi:aspartate beta-hydroxylase